MFKVSLNTERLESRKLCSVTRDLLYVRVQFSDQNSAPETYTETTRVVNTTSNLIRNYSCGKENINATVRDVRLPYNTNYYGDNIYLISRHASDVLSRSGINLSTYEHKNFRYNSPYGSFAGMGEVGGKITWTKNSDPGVYVHELGHNLGLRHSSFVNPDNNSNPFGPGRTFEYGDIYSNMGNGRYNDWNATQKWALGYINNYQVRTVSSNTFSVVVTSHDDATNYDNGNIYLVKIPIGNNSIYAEYRRDAGGIVIHVANSFRPTGDTLIDCNPQTEWSTDAALKVGQSVTNFRNPGLSDDIRITVNSVAGNKATISVTYGAVKPTPRPAQNYNSNLIAAFAEIGIQQNVDRCKIRNPVIRINV